MNGYEILIIFLIIGIGIMFVLLLLMYFESERERKRLIKYYEGLLKKSKRKSGASDGIDLFSKK